jgi:LysM repeat protein
MSRSRRRVSRGLIGLLVLTITFGLIAYFHNTSRTKATEASPASKIAIAPEPPAVHVETPVASSPATQPLESLTSAPSTQPAAFASSVSPATQPTRRAHLSSSGDPIADGKAKIDGGDLLAARRILNDALLADGTSASQSASIKQLLAQISQTVVFSPKRFADDEFGGTYSVQTGDVMRKIAANHGVTSELLCHINGLSDPRRLRAGATLKVVKGPFNALVSKKDFTLEIWLGDPEAPGSYYVKSYGVGLGRDDSTPTGKWLVEPQKKLKNPTYYSPRGEGVIAADDPRNPLGECWIGLTGVDGHAVGKQSYGIHGTIEPDSIGKMASMGCIRMHNEDVTEVFELLVEGKSTVTVKD